MNNRALKSADSVRVQLTRIMEKLGQPLVSPKFGTKGYYSAIQQTIVSGFFMQVAHLESNGHYLTVKDNQVVKLHPSTVLNFTPEWVIYNEFVLTTCHYIRTVTEVKPDWLLDNATKYYDLSQFPACEGKRALENILIRRMKATEKVKKRKDRSREEEEEESS